MTKQIVTLLYKSNCQNYFSHSQHSMSDRVSKHRKVAKSLNQQSQMSSRNLLENWDWSIPQRIFPSFTHSFTHYLVILSAHLSYKFLEVFVTRTIMWVSSRAADRRRLDVSAPERLLQQFKELLKIIPWSPCFAHVLIYIFSAMRSRFFQVERMYFAFPCSYAVRESMIITDTWMIWK